MNKITIQALVLSLGLASCGAWGMQPNMNTLAGEIVDLSAPLAKQAEDQTLAALKDRHQMTLYSVPFASNTLLRFVTTPKTVASYEKPTFEATSNEKWEYCVHHPKSNYRSKDSAEKTYSFDKEVDNQNIHPVESAPKVFGHGHQKNLCTLINRSIDQCNTAATAICDTCGTAVRAGELNGHLEKQKTLTPRLEKIKEAEKHTLSKYLFLAEKEDQKSTVEIIKDALPFCAPKNRLTPTAYNLATTSLYQLVSAVGFSCLGGIGLLSTLYSRTMRKSGPIWMSLALVGIGIFNAWQSRKTTQDLDKEITPAFKAEKDPLETQQDSLNSQKKDLTNKLKDHAQTIKTQYAKLQDAQDAMAEIKVHKRMLIEEAKEALEEDTTNNEAAQTAKMYHDFCQENCPEASAPVLQ